MESGRRFWAGTTLSNWHTSPGYAAGGVDNLGNPKNSANGSMYQQVTIPSNATSASLTYWYDITTSETTTTAANDNMSVTIRDASNNFLATVGLYSNLNATSGYLESSAFSLSAYIGQTVHVFFAAVSNVSLPTVFRVDDVNLTVTTPAPAATTGAATNVTNSSATLNGTVNPNGTSTSAYFEYGPTTNYGFTTSPGVFGSGTSPVQVSSVFTDLNQDTIFHYRLVAVNSNGDTTFGNDVVFSTSLPAPSLNVPVASTSPTFTWSQITGNQGYRIVVDTNPNNLPTDANSFTDASATINDTTSPGGNTYTWTGTPLQGNTTYYWEVHALGVNSGGMWSSQGSFITPTTIAAPTVTVTSPNGGENWVAGSTQTITWTGTGSNANMAYYKIALSTDGGVTWPTAGTANDLTPDGIFDPIRQKFHLDDRQLFEHHPGSDSCACIGRQRKHFGGECR